MPFGIDYATGRRIVVLGAPVILAMISQTSINIVDTIFVGMLEGRVATAGQSAIGISLPVYWGFGGFCSALGIGTQALVARRHGEHDPGAAGATLTNSLVLAVVLSAVFTTAGWFLLPAIFDAMHEDPMVRSLGVEYARIRFIGMVSMVATFSYKAFYDGTERTWVHLVASLAMGAANIVLNIVLIFGKLGFPRLEVAGASIASLAASFLGLAVMIAFTVRSGDLRRSRPYRPANVNHRTLWSIARLSLPSGLATAVVMTGFVAFLRIVGWIDEMSPEGGSVHTAATKIIMDVLSICFIGCLGLGTGTATLVSKSLGEKNPELAERYGREALKIGAYLFGAIGLLEAVFPEAVLGIFTSDPQVIAAAIPSMRLMGCVEGLMAAGIVATQCLFGAGNMKFVMYAEGILHFGLLIPLAYVLGVRFDLGMIGIWSAAAAYIVAFASIMAIKFLAGGWKAIRI